jgi:hypothetical protein
LPAIRYFRRPMATYDTTLKIESHRGECSVNLLTKVRPASRLLGHGSLRTTQRYLSLADPIVHRDYDVAMTRLLAEAPPC